MIKKKLNVNILALVVIIFVSLFSYSNSFQNGFLLDDDVYFISNPTLNSVSAVSLFHQAFKGFYRPLAVAFLKYELFLFGNTNPFGYHFVNFVLFCFISWLFFILILKLFKNPQIAILCAIFYAVHPINNFLVNYKTASAISICLLYMQLSAILFIDYLDQNRKNLLYLSLIFYGLSLFSSEISIALPFYLFLISYFFKDIKLKRNIALCSLYLMPLLLYFIIRLNIAGLNQASRISDLDMNFFQYLATTIKLIVWYLTKLINPRDIVFLWDEKIVKFYNILGILLFLAATIGICIYSFIKGKKKINAFGITLLLSGFIPILLASFVYTYKTHTAMIEPHWFGFSSVGYFLLAANFFVYLRKYIPFKIWIPLLVILIAFTSFLTRKNNVVWANDESYCTYWLVTNRFNDQPRYCLARADIRKKDKGLDPQRYENCNEVANLGYSFFTADESQRAMDYYRMALEMDAKCVYALYGLGLIYEERGDLRNAEKYMLEALQYEPKFPSLYYDLIKLYEKEGKEKKAQEVKEMMSRVLK